MGCIRSLSLPEFMSRFMSLSSEADRALVWGSNRKKSKYTFPWTWNSNFHFLWGKWMFFCLNFTWAKQGLQMQRSKSRLRESGEYFKNISMALLPEDWSKIGNKPKWNSRFFIWEIALIVACFVVLVLLRLPRYCVVGLWGGVWTAALHHHLSAHGQKGELLKV